MADLEAYMGAYNPQTTQAATASDLFETQPTTGQVVGAYVGDTFRGAGSLSQYINASYIHQEENRGSATLSEDEWKKSDFFRPELQYHPEMTENSAKVLSEISDDRQTRQLIERKASTFQSAVGMTTGFLSGIAEPVNFASGALAVTGIGAAGLAVPTLGRMLAVNSVKAAAARGAAEGVIGAAMTEPLNYQSAKIVQDDYNATNVMTDIGLGAILGSGFGALGKHLEMRSEAKKAGAYKPADEGIAVKEFDTALTQMTEGRNINVEHVSEIDSAQNAVRAQNELPRIDQKINDIQTATNIKPVTELPEFKDWFGESKVINEDGNPQVFYHGTKNDFIGFDKSMDKTDSGFWFAEAPTASRFAEASREGFTGEGSNVIPVYLSIENPYIHDKKADFGLTAKEVVEQAKKQGHDGVLFTGEKSGSVYVAFEPGQVKSVFNRGAFDKSDPRLHDVKQLEKLQGQKDTALLDAKQPIDKEPIGRALDDAIKPDNSSAYDPKETEKINDFMREYGNLEDDAALEKSLGFMEEDIQAMKDEGILTGEQLATLDKLANIDSELEMHDNVLRSAFLCLTRG